MGLDGGTKITRSDVLRGQSWRMAQQDTSRSTRGGTVNHVYQEQQLDEQIRRITLWTTCALSGLTLQPPVVADALGQLFNKQAVLEHLLAAKACAAAVVQPASGPVPAAAATPAAPTHAAAGSITPYSAPVGASKDLAAACVRYENQQRAAAAAAAAAGSSVASQGTFDHIRSLKDVFAVILTPNPDVQPAAVLSSATSAAVAANGATEVGCQDALSPWMCPVTLQPCGSKQPFSALRRCGHVLCDKALAAITPAASHKARRAAAGPQHTSGQPDEQDSDELGSCAVCCCPVCDAPFDAQADRVLINGSQQHMDAVRKQLQEAAAAKARAKEKKRKRADTSSAPQQHLLGAGQSQGPKQLQLTGGGDTGAV